jgi:hypothetical protein
MNQRGPARADVAGCTLRSLAQDCGRCCSAGRKVVFQRVPLLNHLEKATFSALWLFSSTSSIKSSAHLSM